MMINSLQALLGAVQMGAGPSSFTPGMRYSEISTARIG